MEEIETTIYTKEDIRVHVSELGDDGAWMRISNFHASMSVSLSRKEAEQLLAGLQAIISKEVKV